MPAVVGVADLTKPYDDALRASRKKLKKFLTPTDMVTYASLLQLNGDFEEANSVADRCLRLYPNDARAHYVKALLTLLDGDYERGFALHENRLAVFSDDNSIASQGHQWDGQASDKIVFCWQEGGAGDAIQYVRWWPKILAICPNAILSVQPNLFDLFSHNFMGSIVKTLDASEPGNGIINTDQQCSMLSLPYLLGIKQVSGEPYLNIEPELIDHWRALLLGKPRVGFCWKGNPRHERDLTRSIPDDVAMRLGERHDLFSLLPEHSMAKTFADTAAIVANMDLIITVDTSIAHLGGAMGKPTWVLLPVDVDWRWQRHRADSPWYDSVRLFRCPAHGTWQTVLAVVASELAQR